MEKHEGYTEHDTPAGKLLILEPQLYGQFQTFLEDAGLQHWFTWTGEDYE